MHKKNYSLLFTIFLDACKFGKNVLIKSLKYESKNTQCLRDKKCSHIELIEEKDHCTSSW